MSGTTIEVTDWHELDLLAAAMEAVGEQMRATTSYAVDRVCRRDGFATSPACLLRPLAEVMDLVAAAFDEAGRVWRDDWQRLHDATTVAAHELRVVEHDVRTRFAKAA